MVTGDVYADSLSSGFAATEPSFDPLPVEGLDADGAAAVLLATELPLGTPQPDDCGTPERGAPDGGAPEAWLGAALKPDEIGIAEAWLWEKPPLDGAA